MESAQVIKSECHLASFLLCWGIAIRCFLSLHYLVFKYFDVFFCSIEIVVMKRHLELTLIYWNSQSKKPQKPSRPQETASTGLIFLLPGCIHSALNAPPVPPMTQLLSASYQNRNQVLSDTHWLVLLVSIFDGYTLGEKCKHMAKAETGIGIVSSSALLGYELLNARPLKNLPWHTDS